MTITDEMALRAARAEAAFARREYDAMSRLDRERYLARARAALTAALEGREEPDATAAYMAGSSGEGGATGRSIVRLDDAHAGRGGNRRRTRAVRAGGGRVRPLQAACRTSAG